MPIYEYECGKCGNEYSDLVMNKEEEKKVKCPKCNSKKRERIFSSFGLVADLSTNMPKPDLSNLPPSVRKNVRLGEYIEEKDRPKQNK